MQQQGAESNLHLKKRSPTAAHDRYLNRDNIPFCLTHFTMARVFFLSAIALLIACVSAKSFDKYATFMVCDRRSKKPTYKLGVSTSPIVIESTDCRMLIVKGKVTGKMKENQAEMWPIDGETYKGLQDMREYVYLCDHEEGGGTVTMKNDDKDLYKVFLFSTFQYSA